MRSRFHRFGALSLALLLQVFVLSGFIHPCCLGGEEGSHDAHDSGTAAHGAPASEDTHGGGGHAMAAGGPLGSAPMAHHDHGQTPPSEDVQPVDDDGAHSGDHPGGGCEGNCGLCCQSAGGTFLPGPIPAVHGLEDGVGALQPAKLGVSVLPAPPAFLLPFANAPPSPATVIR
jgi:hypothetical protein